MITAFHLYFTRRRFTVGERSVLFRLLDSFARTEDGSWLDEAGYRDLDYYWCDALKDGDVIGARLPVGRSIYLKPNPSPTFGADEFWLSSMAPTVVHEVRHVWQRRRYGLFKYFWLNLASRLWYSTSVIEVDAVDAELKAEEFFGATVYSYVQGPRTVKENPPEDCG